MQKVSELVSQNVGNIITNFQTWGGILTNVKSYGAKGDGITDDTAAINSAIAALKLAGGGVLFLPKGTYKTTNHIVIDFDNCHVMGAGIGATIIKVYAWIDGIRVSDSTYPTATVIKKNIIIEDLTIDGNRSGYVNGASDTYGNGINLNAVDNVIIRNIHVKDVAEQGIVHTYYSVGGVTEQSLTIDSCIVENCQTNRISIGVEGQASKCRVTNNSVFSSNNITGIYAGNIGGPTLNGQHIISGNTVKGGSGGIGIRVEDQQSKVIIGQNIIEGFDYSIRCSSTTLSTYDYLISTNYCIDWVSGAISLFPLNGTDDSKALITGNQIKSTLASGSSRAIWASKNAMVCNNRIENGAIGIITIGDGHFISGNWIAAVGYAIDAGTSNNAKIMGNYCATDINMGTLTVNFGNTGFATQRWTELYLGTKKHIASNAAPLAGTYNTGDIVYNTAPVATGYVGWVCVAGGTPGTWKGFGTIQA